ncbi:serine hydrolase [Reyranella sp. CPCC 100927]|uniref:serine hydrolase domain-containing protein n=1 Tax=Reyranella sp. CPCC 100927 TaxID=2599616 RepID=UPI0011B5AECE|nr:serine hydrolase domain-containing protein [Reyranella sp. CPCC 100927]TWT10095.1 beta-lactamase family protein [Reyranella sp. CPCC 100927]
MSAKDQVIATAVANQDVPFAVAMAGNAKGVTYAGAAGDAAPGRKAALDTVFRIFSMTKAVGTTAAMILVDRGKLDVDTPVEDILPEFAKIQVIDRFDGDKPVMRAPRRKATVRHLATHTSGLAYEFWNADVGKYMAATGHPSILAGTKAAMFYPMACDPGTRWEYGIGIDWLGQVVEKIDGRRIDRFLQDEIFGPLGMKDTACEVLDHMRDRLAAVSIRGEDGTFGPFEIAPPAQPEFYGMGHTLYSTAPDYLTFLRLFLNKGALNDHRVLSEKGVERMLTDHMNGLAFDKMITVAPAITADVDLFPGTRKTHSFGFLRNEADIPGMRSAGSQSWAGVCNTHYWFDPQKDVAAVIMTQSLPFVEPPLVKTYEAYERAVYAG